MTPVHMIRASTVTLRQSSRLGVVVAALATAAVTGRWMPVWLPTVGLSAAVGAIVQQRCRWRPSATPPRAASAHLRPHQRRRIIAAHYPDAVELIVLAIRAGHSGVDAFRAVIPHLQPVITEAFGTVLHRVDMGDRFSDALTALRELLGHEATALADTFAAAERHGLPLAPILERLADEARRQRRRRADALARQLPVRLAAPLVLCTLPSFVLLAVAPLVLSALSSLEW